MSLVVGRGETGGVLGMSLPESVGRIAATYYSFGSVVYSKRLFVFFEWRSYVIFPAPMPVVNPSSIFSVR